MTILKRTRKECRYFRLLKDPGPPGLKISVPTISAHLCSAPIGVQIVPSRKAQRLDGYCAGSLARVALVPVGRRLNNTMHRINRYRVDKGYKTNHAIHWFVIYPVGSVFHLLNNRARSLSLGLWFVLGQDALLSQCLSPPSCIIDILTNENHKQVPEILSDAGRLGTAKMFSSRKYSSFHGFIFVCLFVC